MFDYWNFWKWVSYCDICSKNVEGFGVVIFYFIFGYYGFCCVCYSVYFVFVVKFLFVEIFF